MIHVGEDCVKKARVQVLKRQFDRMIMEDSETISVFSQKLSTVVGEIRSLGTEVKDNTVVEKLFDVVPYCFLPIVGTIEQWSDVSTMSISEAIGRLKAFEESLKRRRHRKEEEGEQLMLSRAQWEALSIKEKEGGQDSNSDTTNRSGRGGQSGRGGRGGHGDWDR